MGSLSGLGEIFAVKATRDAAGIRGRLNAEGAELGFAARVDGDRLTMRMFALGSAAETEIAIERGEDFELETGAYNPFNLLVADREHAFAITYDESPRHVPLLSGAIVIGNAEFLSDFVARALATVDGGFFVENLRFAQNLIDWTGLDNDMLGIRARGLVSRRLERIGEGEEVFIEAVNYVVPVVLLAALGIFLHWKRRQTPPLVSPPGETGMHGEVGR